MISATTVAVFGDYGGRNRRL